MRIMEDSVKAQGHWLDKPTPEEVALMYKNAALALPRDSTTPRGRVARPNDRQWRTVLNQLQTKVSCTVTTVMPTLTVNAGHVTTEQETEGGIAC